jgi:hypothetical protein
MVEQSLVGHNDQLESNPYAKAVWALARGAAAKGDVRAAHVLVMMAGLLDVAEIDPTASKRPAS